MNTSQIHDATNRQLYDWMANALATTSCSGHTKGNMNESFASRYREELIQRGQEIPEIDFWESLEQNKSYRETLQQKGVYNGEGSF